MPAPKLEQLGPLAALVGTWEGDEGLDVAYSNDRGEIGETKYRERTTFSPFGPVDNGAQHLFGLDYRTAAWRVGEDDPFHTEVGYWLWDSATNEVLRGFVVPRGITVLAGGTATADATSFTLMARPGDPNYNIGENKYLTQHASTLSYDATITINDDGSVSGSVTAKGMQATASHIHQAAAGSNGKVIVPFTKEGDTFSAPAGAKLTADQMKAFKAGDLYVNIHSAAHPGGEVRAQLKP